MAMNSRLMDAVHSRFSAVSLRRQLLGMLIGASAVWLQLSLSAGAGDPFRLNNPHPISDTSEQAFYAMFRDGNYVAAREYLDNADAEALADPMYHALGAAFAYFDEDWQALAERAALTQQSAIDLVDEDPLRGNLYQAVGIFLEGAHVLQTEGIARGTPRALSMLQQVFSRIEAAERINPEDPELSLLKGFMDLLLAVNLPFANPERAIERLEAHGYPTYVAYRGIAIGYRDLGRNQEALDAIDVALEAAPENPDLLYLKAQILARMERYPESVEVFSQALEYADQLPPDAALQIAIERCQAQGEPRSVCKEQLRDQYGN